MVVIFPVSTGMVTSTTSLLLSYGRATNLFALRKYIINKLIQLYFNLFGYPEMCCFFTEPDIQKQTECCCAEESLR